MNRCEPLSLLPLTGAIWTFDIAACSVALSGVRRMYLEPTAVKAGSWAYLEPNSNTASCQSDVQMLLLMIKPNV
jgi:hypothetical protein